MYKLNNLNSGLVHEDGTPSIKESTLDDLYEDADNGITWNKGT